MWQEWFWFWICSRSRYISLAYNEDWEAAFAPHLHREPQKQQRRRRFVLGCILSWQARTCTTIHSAEIIVWVAQLVLITGDSIFAGFIRNRNDFWFSQSHRRQIMTPAIQDRRPVNWCMRKLSSWESFNTQKNRTRLKHLIVLTINPSPSPSSIPGTQQGEHSAEWPLEGGLAEDFHASYGFRGN